MNFFDKITKFFGFKEKTKTDEIKQERAKLKKEIAKKLKNSGFSSSEINEVLDILKKCEEEIQIIKDSLIGTNINNDKAVEITTDALNQIRNLELQAASEMREKIAEIRSRKQK